MVIQPWHLFSESAPADDYAEADGRREHEQEALHRAEAALDCLLVENYLDELPADFSRGPVDEHGTYVGRDAEHGVGATVPIQPIDSETGEPAGWATAYADGWRDVPSAGFFRQAAE